MLPKRIPKTPKRATRWRSQAHLNWIRGFVCCVCGSATNIVPAHVRLGSNTGIGQKPDDWRVVPLCDGRWASADGALGCHNRQHTVGEATFWADKDVDALLQDFGAASPRAAEIRRVKAERLAG